MSSDYNVHLSNKNGDHISINLDLLIQSIQPIGVILAWYYDINVVPIPDGWALCTGQIVNGITTPDLRGRSILMPPNGVGCNYTADNTRACVGLGTAAGEAQHNLTGAEIPAHNHAFGRLERGHRGGCPGLCHGGNSCSTVCDEVVATDHFGGNQYHNIVHPVLGVNYIMKVAHPKKIF